MSSLSFKEGKRLNAFDRTTNYK